MSPVGGLSDFKVKTGGSGRTELLYGRGPLVVFHHIRKTAGSSLRAVLEAQFPKKRTVFAPVVDQGHPPPEGLRDWYGRLWAVLREQPKLACINGHSANYLFDVLDRPAFKVTLTREPVDRVLSRYHFTRGHGPAPDRRGFGSLVREMPLEEIFDRYGGGSPATSPEHRLLAQLFNGQARSLLDPICDTSRLAFSDGPPDDADFWRERLAGALSAYDRVGTRERFDQFACALGDEFGWDVSRVPQVKVRPNRTEVNTSLATTVRSFNWLDAELHTQAQAPSSDRAF